MIYNINIKDIVYQLIPHFLRGNKLISYVYSLIKPLQEINRGQNYADYSSSNTYAVNDKIKYNNNYYFCNTAITVPENFNETKWTSLGATSVFFDLVENINTKLTYNSQKLMLEKYLNITYDGAQSDFDSYDPINDIYYNEGEILATSDNKPRIQIISESININYIYNEAESATPIYLYNNWDNSVSYLLNDRIHYQGYIYKCILAHSSKIPTNSTYWNQESSIDYYYNSGQGLSGTDFTVRVPSGLLGTLENKFIADINQWKLASKNFEIQYY